MAETKLHDHSGNLRPTVAFIALLAGVVAAFAADAPSLRLQLRNGDTVSGQLVSESPTNLVLRTPWAANLAVSKAEVVKRDALPAVAPVALKPAPVAPAVAAQPVAPVLKLVPPKPAAPPAAKPKSEWSFELEVGADLAFSTVDRSVYHGRVRVNNTYGRLRNSGEFRTAYGDAQGRVTENRFDASLKTDLDLNQRKFFLYNLAGVSMDKIRNIDLRYEIGPGVGYHLIQKPKFTLDVESGAAFEHREFANRSADEHLLFRLAEKATWNISSKLSMNERFEIFPNLDQLGEFRIRFEANIRYSFWKNVYLTLGLIDQWESDPAPGVSQNDLQIRTSVGARF